MPRSAEAAPRSSLSRPGSVTSLKALEGGPPRCSFDAPAYIGGIAEQANEMKGLQERIIELEAAVKRERHRAELCQQQLEQCLQYNKEAAAALGVGSSGGGVECAVRQEEPAASLHATQSVHAPAAWCLADPRVHPLLGQPGPSGASSSAAQASGPLAAAVAAGLAPGSDLPPLPAASRYGVASKAPSALYDVTSFASLAVSDSSSRPTSGSLADQEPGSSGQGLGHADCSDGSDGGTASLQLQQPGGANACAAPHGAGGIPPRHRLAAQAAGGGGGVGPCQGQQPYAEGEQQEYVTIPKKEYDLLLLKVKAMDVLQEGITIADCSLPDMPLIYANAGFARTTGYSIQYTVGKNCRFLQGPGTDPEPMVELRQAISAGRSCVVQLLNYKKNGDPFINYLSITPIYDAAGRLTHYVGVQSDVTELVNHKRAELAAKHVALQAAVATEAKSQFLARMSHEIRTPLNGMIAVGQLLAETSLTPAQWDLVNTIRCSGETLLTLITDILDFSRIEANKMVLNLSVFKLDTVIEAAMEIAGLRAAQRRLQVAYHVTDDTPRVLYGDAQRLQQILLNILNNGVKFTEEGELLLEVWPSPAGPEEGSAPSSSSQRQQHAGTSDSAAPPTPVNGPEADWPCIVLNFSVRDTGIGISPDDLGRLFLSFSQVDASPTRRYGGSGLGLAISKRLCEAMGGQMWVESHGLSKGSTFSWTITVRVPPREQAPGGSGRRNRARRSSLVAVSRPSGPQSVTTPRSGVGPGSAGPGSVGVRTPLDDEGALVGSGQEQEQQELRKVTFSKNEGLNAIITAAASAELLSHVQSSLGTASGGSGVPYSAPGLNAYASDTSLPLLRGKKVLIVEPCIMVRQVLMPALRSWGCRVCGVETEAQAIGTLVAAGTLSEAEAPEVPPEGPHRPCMTLRHVSDTDSAAYEVAGPFDVVMLDMRATALLAALMKADDREAQRLVFMGWPGQNELEAEPPPQQQQQDSGAAAARREAATAGPSPAGAADAAQQGASVLPGLPSATQSGAASAAQQQHSAAMYEYASARSSSNVAARPPRAVTDEMNKPHNRQLGYVTVTRPVRQGRLKLALEEVLMMQLDATSDQMFGTDDEDDQFLDYESMAPQGSASLGRQGPGAGSSSWRPTFFGSNAGRYDVGPSGCGSAGEMYLTSNGVQGGNPHSLSGSVGAAYMVSDRSASGNSSRTAFGSLRPALVKKPGSGSELSDMAGSSLRGTHPSEVRILLAEDNAINMKVALGILHRIGYSNVVTAENGVQALEAITSRGGADSFDVVLMDLHMPLMGGLEAVAELGQRYPNRRCRVVAVTADAFEDTRDSCLSGGFDGWLTKPFRVEDLLRVVGENVQRSRQQAQQAHS